MEFYDVVCKKCLKNTVRNSEKCINKKKICKTCSQRTRKKVEIKSKFRLPIEVYEDMLIAQLGVCAICKQRESVKIKKSLAVDHCHTTGKIRGLLCSRCNIGLGYFRDNEKYLQSAIDYLKAQDNTTNLGVQ
jgi:hypothetical protein